VPPTVPLDSVAEYAKVMIVACVIDPLNAKRDPLVIGSPCFSSTVPSEVPEWTYC
jgi:hypothetical protein